MIVASICHRKKLLRLSKVTRQAERTKSVMPGSARCFRLRVSARWGDHWWGDHCSHYSRLRKAKSQIRVAGGGANAVKFVDSIGAEGYE